MTHKMNSKKAKNKIRSKSKSIKAEKTKNTRKKVIAKKANLKKNSSVSLRKKMSSKKNAAVKKAKEMVLSSKKVIDNMLPEMAQQILARAQAISEQLKKKVNSK